MRPGRRPLGEVRRGQVFAAAAALPPRRHSVPLQAPHLAPALPLPRQLAVAMPDIQALAEELPRQTMELQREVLQGGVPLLRLAPCSLTCAAACVVLESLLDLIQQGYLMLDDASCTRLLTVAGKLSYGGLDGARRWCRSRAPGPAAVDGGC